MNRSLYILAGIFACELFLGITWAQAQKNSYRIAPEPAWISKSPFANPSNSTNSSGVIYLLLDHQVDLQSESIFSRKVKRITSESGVQDESQLEFTYEPSHETLELHKIELRRAGQSFDRLKPETLRVIQREKDSYRHIFNGEEAVVAILEDVRVGDEIEYSYTIRGFNRIFGNRYVGGAYVQYSVPIVENRIRVLSPRGRPDLKFKVHGGAALPLIEEKNGIREYLWNFKNLAPLTLEDRLPGWFQPYPWIQFSEFESWPQVRDWASELFTLPATLSDDEMALVQHLKKENNSAENQVLAALRFMQEEVRYLGIEIGANSHKPNPPAMVLSRRFGDCKDKTVLLCAILRGLGIEAEPALVNTYLSTNVTERLASPLAFNHVIARAKIDGKTYWLDPTLTHQRGGLQDVSVDDYTRALVVNQNDDNLTEISRKALSGPTKIVNEKLVVHDYAGPADLVVETIFSGASADSMRRWTARYSVDELQKEYLNYYLGLYPAVSNSAPLTITDDTAANRLTTVETYHLKSPWPTHEDRDADYYASFTGSAIVEAVAKPTTLERTMPLGRTFPSHIQHVISIDLPKPGDFEDESKTIEDAFQRFHLKVKHSGKNLRLTYEYQSLADTIPVENIPAYLQKLEEIRDSCSYPALFPKTNPDKASFEINWPILAFAAMSVCLLGIAAAKYYFWKPVPAATPTTEGIDPKLDGLRGWLILVGIGLIRSPFGIIGTIKETASAYTPQSWHYLTSPGSEGYHPFYAVVLIGELFGNLTILVVVLLALVLFFQRRSTFPRLYIAFLLFNVCFQIADVAAMRAIPALAADITQQDYRGATRAIFGACIWVSYMLKSKRVKATFVR